jgi:hypothetical protein
MTATVVDGSDGFDELYEQGLTKYVGMFAPSNDPQAAEGVKTFEFEVPDDPSAGPRGPLCLRGGGYTVDTREGSSDELMIFLQGGGACWEDFCSAFEETNFLPPSGILNPDLAGNPVADWDVVYLPYCDGSLFAGDVDRILPNSIVVRAELRRAWAGADRISLRRSTSRTRDFRARVRFSDRRERWRIGTITALPLLRYYYPTRDLAL